MHDPSASPASLSPLRADCIALLGETQNPDGGWGFHAGEESRVEPTAWVVRALSGGSDAAAREKAFAYLRGAQLADGSWPASPQIATGSWVTSHACEILAADAASSSQVQSGLRWLCDDLPRDSSLAIRLLKKLRPSTVEVAQDDSLRAWGWTPRTASWVEPTAFALIALRGAEAGALPKMAGQRRDSAVSLLYDRMCPGGGWNCGNPRVYGVDGEALVLPTCWALLALRDAPEQPGRAKSLQWLQGCFGQITSAASLAAGIVTLHAYGIAPAAARRTLDSFLAAEIARQGTHVLSWAVMACDPARSWPVTAKGWGKA
jgi:hypothetical protein